MFQNSAIKQLRETVNNMKKRSFLGLMAATTISATLSVTMAASVAFSADVIPAIVFDLGGKFDKSFNESAYNGAEKFTKETGIKYRSFEIQNASQREQAYRRFARDGNNPVIAMGFASAEALTKIAKEFPDTKFAIIDSVVDLPNVRSIKYNEHEGSFLVGVLAAKVSKTGKVGFIGGMDIPLIRTFGCGYVQGVKSVNPDATVFQNMTGTTGAAWNNPVKGGELTKSQINQGADVIYAAAGSTGLGVLQAAADAGKFSIGVDSNQNYLHPGSVLTSMLKRVDIAVYNAFMDVKNDKWSTGKIVLGLKEGGVGYAVDDNNMKLISDDMKAAVSKSEADIISGALKVHDYNSDNNCPVK
jgi:basic membrane protein A